MTKGRGFTLVELLVVITIIGILANIGLNTFTSSQKKGRDARRKAHLKQLSDAFEAYYNDKNKYPGSTNGNIKGCGADAEEACVWGTSAFKNETTGTVYMVKLPEDATSGYAYYYASAADGLSFQVYARLENTLDPGVPKDADGNSQVYEGLPCGNLECNYGISSTNTTPESGRTLVTE